MVTDAVHVRTWLVVLLGAAALVGCSVFLAFQNLGNAALDATVASFFLALLTAAGSLIVLSRSKSRQEATHGAKESKSTGRVLGPKRIINILRGNENVQTGDGSIMVVNQAGPQHPSLERHRRPARSGR
jgi:hypothetical protein